MTPRALEIAKQTCDAWELQLGPLESLIASSLDAYANERLEAAAIKVVHVHPRWGEEAAYVVRTLKGSR